MLAAAMGWLGTLGTFGAYVLLWRGHLASASLRYALLNAVGGLLAGTASALYGAWPSAASNFVWAAIGLHTAVTRIRSRLVRSRLVRSCPVRSRLGDVPTTPIEPVGHCSV